MRYAVIRRYGLSVALPDGCSNFTDAVQYEPDWDGLIRGDEERKKLLDRLEVLKEEGILPIAVVFVPRREQDGMSKM